MKTRSLTIGISTTLLLSAAVVTHRSADALINGAAIEAEGSGFVHVHAQAATCSGTFVASDTIVTNKSCFVQTLSGGEIMHAELAGWFMGSADSDDNPVREIHVHPAMDLAMMRLTKGVPMRGAAPYEITPREPSELASARMTCNGYGALTTGQLQYGTQLTSGSFLVASIGSDTLNVNSNVLFSAFDQGGGCIRASEGRTLLVGIMGKANVNPMSITAPVRRFITAFGTWHDIAADDSDQCIEVVNSSLERGAPVALTPCSDKPSQQWEMKLVESDNVEIRQRHSNQCLTYVSDASIAQATCAGDMTDAHPGQLAKTRLPRQLWKPTESNGHIMFQSIENANKCLTVPTGRDTAGARMTMVTCDKTAHSQFWRISASTLDARDHRLAGLGGCAYAKNSRNGGAVAPNAQCSGKDGELWKFDRADRPWFRIESREGRYARCLANGGAGAQEADCSTADGQKWRLEWHPQRGDASPMYLLRSKQGGLCATRSPSSIDQKPCDVSDSKQLWTIE